MKSLLILGSVAAVVSFAPAAAAKSPAEIEQIAKSVSVEIQVPGADRVGSGVIVHRQGNLYTVITNRHVVCGSGNCDASRLSKIYRLRTADGQVHQVSKSAVQFLKDSAGNSLDLASVQFRSDRAYQVAKVAGPGSLKVDDAVYTAGFPKGQGWLFGSGQAQAVVNKRLLGDGGGYTVIYNAETQKGMSGGGAFDKNGRLVAVHGQGDRFTENTEAEVERSNIEKAEVGSKIGSNRGIPVRWLVEGLGVGRGILVSNRKPLSQMGMGKATAARTADEFFIEGFNKLVGADGDFRVEKREAVAQFSRAVALNPRYVIAYFMRAKAKDQLNDPQGALADYDQVIFLDPKLAAVYYSRGSLKGGKLNDAKGALADYNQAIALDPKLALAYNNRGLLKYEKLNDAQGALADYSKAIELNPKNALAYYNRGNLKYQKLNDAQGALADYNKAIALDPKLALAYNNRGLLKGDKLNDLQGALADYNRAITFNPKSVKAYNNRGLLKYDKLNDAEGALADFNKAIALNPKYANAYGNRGLMKARKLNDRAGGIADLLTAAKLFRAQGQTQNLQGTIANLRILGATEKP
jgi:tetratricopeptide (TPR) repeat protein